jgi:hypothetical protein
MPRLRIPESRHMSYAHFVNLLFSFQRPTSFRDLRFLVPVAAGVVVLLPCLQTVKKNLERIFQPVFSSSSEFLLRFRRRGRCI